MRLDPRWNSTVIIEPYRTIYRQLSRVLRNHPLFRRCSPLLPSMLDKIPKVTLLAALASTRRPSRWWAKPSGMSCRRVHPIPYWIYLVFWVISNAIKKDISRYSYTFKFFDFAVLSSNKLANPTEGYIKWPRELHADLRDVPVLTLQSCCILLRGGLQSRGLCTAKWPAKRASAGYEGSGRSGFLPIMHGLSLK